MPPSAMIGMPAASAAAGRFDDRRDLRHAHAGNHARRANRTWPDAHFHGVGAGLDQVGRSRLGRHVAGDDVDVPAFLHVADRLDHVGRMAVGTVDHQHVDALPIRLSARS